MSADKKLSQAMAIAQERQRRWMLFGQSEFTPEMLAAILEDLEL